MKVNIALERSIVNPNRCYIVINDGFIWKINKKLFYALADFLKIKVD